MKFRFSEKRLFGSGKPNSLPPVFKLGTFVLNVLKLRSYRCNIQEQETGAKTMKAIIRTGDGGPEVLQLAEVSSPIPAATQLLVDVHATALNRADLIQRRGGYPPPPGESEILGLEIAGTVSAIGDAVENGFPKATASSDLSAVAAMQSRLLSIIAWQCLYLMGGVLKKLPRFLKSFSQRTKIIHTWQIISRRDDSDSCGRERGRQYWNSDSAACRCYCLCDRGNTGKN